MLSVYWPLLLDRANTDGLIRASSYNATTLLFSSFRGASRFGRSFVSFFWNGVIRRLKFDTNCLNLLHRPRTERSSVQLVRCSSFVYGPVLCCARWRQPGTITWSGIFNGLAGDLHFSARGWHQIHRVTAVRNELLRYGLWVISGRALCHLSKADRNTSVQHEGWCSLLSGRLSGYFKVQKASLKTYTWHGGTKTLFCSGHARKS